MFGSLIRLTPRMFSWCGMHLSYKMVGPCPGMALSVGQSVSTLGDEVVDNQRDTKLVLVDLHP